MTMNLKILFCLIFGFTAAATAQLVVTILPPKIIGQKAIVPLAITNNLSQQVESARALCFLLNNQGNLVGQSAKWVIGGTRERLSLKPKDGTSFNFVFTVPQPAAVTNLTARLTFTRLILAGGQVADPNTKIIIQPAKKH